MPLLDRVIDFHAHFPHGWKPRQFSGPVAEYAKKRQQRMHKEWDLPEPDWNVSKEEAEEFWQGEVEKYGLNKVVFVTGGGNDELAQTVSKCDQFMGFAHHSTDDENAAAELKRSIEQLGLCGYKIIAPRTNTPFEADHLQELWQYCDDNRLPVIIHFGLLGRAGGICTDPLINPLTLANTAAMYPNIPFVVPHFGCGYFQELLHLCWSCPNVYIDTSGSNQWMKWMPYDLTLEKLFKKAYETVGPERIIFGTDSSWIPRGFSYRYLQDQVRACHWLGFRDEDIDLIFYRNAARLLKIKE